LRRSSEIPVSNFAFKFNLHRYTKVTHDGETSVSEPFAVATSWGFEKYKNPSEFAPGCW
jgi:20S proteasome subunit beta 7